jgi:hypothetical protein
VTVFDRLQFLRATGYSALALALATAVTLLTDEAASTFGTRVARLGALAPAAALVGAWAAAEQARGRGEVRGLMALGAHPLRAARGVVLAGWLLGAAALFSMTTGLADVRALFPAVALGTEWRPREGKLEAPALGIRVAPSGEISRFPSVAPEGASTAPGAREAVVLLLPVVATGPVWAALPLSVLGRILGLFLSAAPAIALFHAFAIGGRSSFWAALPAVPLVVQTLWALSRVRRAGPAGGR